MSRRPPPARPGVRAGRLPGRFPSRVRCGCGSTGLACHPGHAWPARGAACPLRLDLFPAAPSRVDAGPTGQSGAALSVFTSCWRAAGASSSWGTVSAARPVGFGGFGLSGGFSAGFADCSGGLLFRRGQGVAVGAQALVAGVELAALLVQAALLGGQHANLLLYLHHTGRAARWRGSAPGAGRLPGQAATWPALRAWAASNSARSSGSTPAPARFSSRRQPLPCGPAIGNLLGQAGQALLHAHAAFHHVADLCSSRRHFSARPRTACLALGSPDRPPRSAPGGWVPGQIRQRAGRPCAIRGRSTACRPSRRTLVCSASALARFRYDSRRCSERGVSVQRVVFGGHLGRLFPAFRGWRSVAQDVFHRARFSRVSARRFSVSRRRSLYLETPAASSRNRRSSSGGFR